ncbi:unnamed protein product [Urochloa humidicola]
MSLDTQLILDAMSKLFDKVDASWDARWAKMDAAWEASRGVPAPTQFAVIGVGAVADNRCNLFGGGDVPDEHHYEAPIVADNWGGLLEQPVHVWEEHDLDTQACVALMPESFLTSTEPDVAADIAPVHACVVPVPARGRYHQHHAHKMFDGLPQPQFHPVEDHMCSAIVHPPICYPKRRGRGNQQLICRLIRVHPDPIHFHLHLFRLVWGCVAARSGHTSS